MTRNQRIGVLLGVLLGLAPIKAMSHGIGVTDSSSGGFTDGSTITVGGFTDTGSSYFQGPATFASSVTINTSSIFKATTTVQALSVQNAAIFNSSAVIHGILGTPFVIGLGVENSGNGSRSSFTFTSDHRVGIGMTPRAFLQIDSRVTGGNSPAGAATLAQEHLHIGGDEYGSPNCEAIGFGYNSAGTDTSNFQSGICFTSDSGNTMADYVLKGKLSNAAAGGLKTLFRLKNDGAAVFGDDPTPTSGYGLQVISRSSNSFVTVFSSANSTNIWGVEPGGNVISSGTIPAVGTCTNGAVAITSTDHSGRINFTGANTSCSITFAKAAKQDQIVNCTVSSHMATPAIVDVQVSLTTLTLTATAFANTDYAMYHCVRNGGVSP